MAAPCIKCGRAPKDLPKHLCMGCDALRKPIDVQIVEAYDRRKAAEFLREDRQRVPKEEWPEGERWCAGCFSFRRFDIGRTKLEIRPTDSRCRICLIIAHRLKTYGLTPEMDRKLGTCCNICGNVQRRQALAIDHCHKTGRVRGKLCDRCNHLLLGAGHDSLPYFQSAVRYLEMPPAWAITLEMEQK